jgi:glycerol-3-phosphate acyltransferase PlsY
MVASIFAPFYTAYLFGFNPTFPAVLVMCVLLIWRHRENITKLINGTESKLGSKKSSDATPPATE